jgi:hypothetical protein
MTEQSAHEQKRHLIETIYADALRMQGIDERESMTLMTVDEVTEYYDQLVPYTKDAQVILAAVETEIYIRRSERIAREPVSLGGQPTHKSRTLSLVEKVDTPIEKSERSRMRTVGKNAAAAREYVDAEVKANRKATRTGAVRHAQRGKIAPKVRAATAIPTRSREAAQWALAQQRSVAKGREVLQRLETLADGQRRSDAQLHRLVGQVDDFLHRVQLIPWLTIDRTREGTIFTINPGLREHCERESTHPALEGQTIREFLAHLRREIIRRRKANHDEKNQVRWSTTAILSKEQTDLLNWIETYLERIP